jgi:hypothetical protein
MTAFGCTPLLSSGTMPISTPINIVGGDGLPLRNDNLTNLAYVGRGDGSTYPEQYVAFRPNVPSSTAPATSGQLVILRNLQTGLFCRLAPVPAAYPLSIPGASRRSRALGPPLAAQIGLKAVPASCATFGVVADQPTAVTATVLTYTGFGLSYEGVPLVQTPGSRTLVLSSSPDCTTPGGGQLSFPLAPASRAPPPALVATGGLAGCSRGQQQHAAAAAAAAAGLLVLRD